MPNVFRLEDGHTVPAASFTHALVMVQADGSHAIYSRHRNADAQAARAESKAFSGDLHGRQWYRVAAVDQDELAREDADQRAAEAAAATPFAAVEGVAWGTADPKALADATEVLDYLTTGTESLAGLLPGALDALVLSGKPAELVGVLVQVQDLRAALKTIEDEITWKAGAAFKERAGTLEDGREFTIKRGATRKAWDHDGWKHDVRAAIAAEVVPDAEAIILHPETGEEEPLRRALIDAMTKAQQAGASAPPKVTAMKHYGLDVDDYCETTPGAWSVSFTA